MVFATTFFLSSSGCLPFFMFKYLSSFKVGSIPLICIESFPFENAKSNLPSISWLEIKSSLTSPTIAESSDKILSISSCSPSFNCLNSLFISTIVIGSIKSVAPEDDWSCTIPATCDLYSDFTGTTNLSPLREIIASCKYFW